MNDPRRIRELTRELDDLRRRVRDLEARPTVPTIIIQPQQPAPIYQPYTVPWPYAPIGPTIVYDQSVPPFGAPGTFIS